MKWSVSLLSLLSCVSTSEVNPHYEAYSNGQLCYHLIASMAQEPPHSDVSKVAEELFNRGIPVLSCPQILKEWLD